MTLIGRLIRCATVSVGSTVASVLIIVTLAVGLGVPGSIANIVAVLATISPSYVANRRWVWKRDDRSSYTREVLPFWVMSITGLVLSTIAVGAVDHLTAGWAATARSIALPAANLATWGALWIAQFVVLDRVIFRDRAAGVPPRAGARSRGIGDEVAA
jgi:putative flippase GtrA